MAMENMIGHQQKAQERFHAVVNVFVELENTFNR